MASSPVVAGDTVVVQLENQSDSFAAGIDKRIKGVIDLQAAARDQMHPAADVRVRQRSLVHRQAIGYPDRDKDRHNQPDLTGGREQTTTGQRA